MYFPVFSFHGEGSPLRKVTAAFFDLFVDGLQNLFQFISIMKEKITYKTFVLYCDDRKTREVVACDLDAARADVFEATGCHCILVEIK